MEPTTEIGQKRARRAKWFFTFQIGGVVVVMALLAIVAVVNISEGEDTAAWVALLIAEPVVLALLLWLARRAVKDAER
jgi:Kef-type K+ transport system membrane component KefB